MFTAAYFDTTDGGVVRCYVGTVQVASIPVANWAEGEEVASELLRQAVDRARDTERRHLALRAARPVWEQMSLADVGA